MSRTRPARAATLAILVASTSALTSLAASAAERPAPSAATVERTVPAPPPAVLRSAEVLPEPLPVDLLLPPARETAAASLAEIESWNAAGRLPVREGFVRELTRPVELLGASRSTGSRPAGRLLAAPDGATLLLWGVEVREARATRLKLSGLALPRGARLRVSGEEPGSAAEVDPAAAGPSGDLYTPTVEGPRAWLEVELPGGVEAPARLLAVTGVVELVDLGGRAAAGAAPRALPSPAGTECFVNGECVGPDAFAGVDAVRKAVARMRFVEGSSAYLCTGGLISDAAGTGTPLFLTANHCLSTQAVASTLEATFDYRYTACGSNSAPPVSSRPRTNGATLLATNSSSDFSLLRLSQVPPGTRAFLGWESSGDAVPAGTVLYRLSHPSGWPQTYAKTKIASMSSLCAGWSKLRFLYQDRLEGGTAGGSSGSPVVTAAGKVVGQLSGSCGLNTSNPCEATDNTVDGAFYRTYPIIEPWLVPSGGCVAPSVPTLSTDKPSLSVGEKYVLSWTADPLGTTESWRLGVSTSAGGPFDTVATYPAATRTASFTAAAADAGKTLHYRVQALPFGGTACEGSATTSATVSVTVASGGTTSCAPDVTTLCLASKRFKVQATYRDYEGNSASARAVSLTDDSGYFWFFTSTNVELVGKVVSFCSGSAGNWGFYASGLTDVAVTFTVTDTKYGLVKTYQNALGNRFCTIADGPFLCP